LAWGGLLGGPALLLLVTVLGWQLPGMVTLLLVSGFVGGLVTLILRMNDRPPNDWGGDDGAVV
jgi:Flp pilus assembly protein protease CpaA